MSAQAAHPVTFENIDQSLGFVLYSATIRERPGRHTLKIHGLHDRAQVFIGGAEAATLERGAETSVEIEISEPQTPITILVESQGRVNFAPDLAERTGIVEGVRIGWRWVHGWSSVALDLDRSTHLCWGQERSNAVGPVFYRGAFDVDQPLDAFIGLRGWTKGCVWINGFCLGRYWNRGPHLSLYLPAPLLRHGENELKLLELHPRNSSSTPMVQIRGSHDIT
jgi:beta-galactosidase